MRNNNYIAIILLLFVSLGFSACSKEEDKGLSSKDAGLSMNVDGREWRATITTLFTEQHETSQLGEYYYVYLSASRIIEKNSNTEDDLAETIGLYINIPASKFRNPKGTYPIILEESEMGHAWGIFGSSTDIRDATTYVSGDPNNKKQVVGRLEITDFEIGNQNIFGHVSDSEGYTNLSGSFELDVYPINGDGSKLKITEGKFNLTGAMNFGW